MDSSDPVAKCATAHLQICGERKDRRAFQNKVNYGAPTKSLRHEASQARPGKALGPNPPETQTGVGRWDGGECWVSAQPPDSASRGSWKTPQHRGQHEPGQQALVQHPDVQHVSEQQIKEVILQAETTQMSQVPIWTKSAQSFRDRFRYYCHRFDLDKDNFRCYSLRRGGATWLFQATGSMETALVKGRWSSTKVARLYISDAPESSTAWHPTL